MHRARLHGSSVEFAEHKEYSPGDELRHIDWKALAKLDRYYVKQFEQESQLTAYLVLDASGSMRFAGAGMAKVEYGGAGAGRAGLPDQPAAGQGRALRLRRPPAATSHRGPRAIT
jgi:hypothetical protein